MEYQNSYASQPAYPAQTPTAFEGGELLDGAVISAEQLGDYDSTYTLLPEGDYPFTVVDIKRERHQPKDPAKAKIGPCTKVTLSLRVQDPMTGKDVDIYHTLYMANKTLGMIAQFFDSIGLHKKGDPLVLDWRPEVLIGKTGMLQLNHRANQNDSSKVYNNIKKLYPKEQPAQAPQTTARGWVPGSY